MREYHVSDHILFGIEESGYKDQTCLFPAHHDDGGWSECISHTVGMLWGDWKVCTFETPRSSLAKRIFSKTYPSFLTLKEGSTFLTKPLFNSLYAPSVPPVLGDRNPQGREDVTALQCCICPTCPSPAGGSLTHSQALALSKRTRDVTALRCSEPLRYMVGGPSKVCAMFCGLGPHGENSTFYTI